MTHALTPHPRDPRRRYLEFHGLMPFRVHEILLLSSAYDAFILEEDGPLTDQIFGGYSDLHLTQTPRITHVTSGSAALRLLRQRRFDLVITVVRVEDTDAAEFSKAVKREHPDMGVLLLIFDVADLHAFSGGVTPSTIDQVFLWTGDASILIAGIKVIEVAIYAFVPAAGPVPPPSIVVTPEYSASSTCCGQIQ